MNFPQDNLLYGLAPKLTDEQWAYVNSIFQNQLTIVNAKAGTGKTTLAVMCAKIMGKQLRYIFAPVEEDKLGFTPGEIEDKEAKYVTPLLDALEVMGEKPSLAIHREKDPEFFSKQAWIKAHSHVFARGTNIRDCVVILDECQNFTKSELRKVLTRIHDSCTVIMIGHSQQCDLPIPGASGFVPYIRHFKDEPYAKVCELTVNFRGRLARKADELK